MGEVAVAVVPVLPMATVMVMVIATPSVVLVLTTVTMVINAGPTVLLPTGFNDQAIMYASPCPKLNGQLKFFVIFSLAHTNLKQGLHIPAKHTTPQLLESASSNFLV